MQSVLNIVFALLAGLGILTALLGWNRISAGAHSGYLPQGMLIVGSLLLAAVAFRLRRAWGRMRKRWLPGLVVAAVTLIALELALTILSPPPRLFAVRDGVDL